MQGGPEGLIAGRFEPVDVAGHGGQGRVLKAIDRHHDRLVAVKVRSLRGMDRAEILAEARVLLDVRPHPNLPVVRDDFFDGDRHVMVMDWIDGEDLATSRSERGAPGLPAAEIVDVLADAAAAIDHLHAHEPSVFHQDVKPANLIRTPDGRVVLVDFGVAGAAAARMGTPGFRAPELLAGGDITGAVDVYGLAATAFSLLTGQRPGPGAKRAWDALPAGAMAERTIRRSLATDPARRHPSATALVGELRAWLATAAPVGRATVLGAVFVPGERSAAEAPAATAAALRHAAELFASVAARHGGTTVPASSGHIAVFVDAAAAAAAAVALRDRARRDPWPTSDPVHAHIAVATGDVSRADGVVDGPAVHRCRHLCAAAARGQVLLDEATAGATDAVLADHGLLRLADLGPPVRVLELPGENGPQSPRTMDREAHRLPVVDGGVIVPGALLERITLALRDARLVTVAGEDARATSSAALAAAAASFARFDRIVHVPSIAGRGASGDQIAAAVALAVGVPGEGGAAAVIDALRAVRALVIVDGCDAAMEETAYLIESLLKACPDLRVIATASAPMMVPGEAVVALP